MDKKREELKKIEKEMSGPDFWSDQEKAREVSQRESYLRSQIAESQEVGDEIGELEELLQLAVDDESILRDLEERIGVLDDRVEELSLETYLDGKDDSRSAVLEIHSGAGGRESEDWVAMLERMYLEYAERKEYGATVMERSFGESGGPDGRIGIKRSTVEIVGENVFGFLKRESGVHRLVRISPFSSQSLRHTSFAQVIVYPKLAGTKEIDVDPKEIRVETFRSSGPGGQYTNKTDSAVRMTHEPTGIVVSCQSERSQGRNKQKALEMLHSKLYQRRLVEEKKNMKEMKGEVDPAWGRQIRNYVLHPYKMVKDVRTEAETSNVEGVLDGDIDMFIREEIKLKDDD